MGAVVVGRSRGTRRAAGAPPVHADGTRFRFEAITDRVRVYADTADELLGRFVPGYDTADEPGRLLARLRWAVRVQTDLQATVNDWHGTEGVSAGELRVLTAPRTVPPAPAVWTCRVPLVLLDTDYAPFTGVLRPAGLADTAAAGNVLWLSPQDPYEFVSSLHAVGVMHVSEAVGVC